MDEMNKALYRVLEVRAGDEAVAALFHAYWDYVRCTGWCWPSLGWRR